MRLYILLFVFISLLSASVFAQSVYVITPNVVTAGAKTTLTIRGSNTHFQNGVSQISFSPANIQVKKFDVNNSVTATAIIFGDAQGPCTVTITTRGETVSSVFNVIGAASSVLMADIEVLPLESVSLRDIDLIQPSKTPVLFFANIYNNDTPRTKVSGYGPVDIQVMVLNGSMTRIGTMIYDNKGFGLDLEPMAIKKITNREFDAIKMNGTTAGTTGGDFLNAVELTGVFPADNYTYVMTILKHGTNVPIMPPVTTTNIVTNTISNPVLITPGLSFIEEPPIEYNPMPLFQWFGQNDKYDFAIYEVRPGQSQEEVARNVPVYKQNDVRATSLLYPNSAEKLISGRTYAWQIKGKMASSGNNSLPSELFRFTYTDAMNEGVKPVKSIRITPEEVTMAKDGTYQFTVSCYDEHNILIPDAKLKWTVTPNGGSITDNGLFTATKANTTVAVLVSSGTVTEFVTVTIGMSLVEIMKSGFINPFDGFLNSVFGLK